MHYWEGPFISIFVWVKKLKLEGVTYEVSLQCPSAQFVMRRLPAKLVPLTYPAPTTFTLHASHHGLENRGHVLVAEK